MQKNARNSINNYDAFGKKVNEIIFPSSKLPVVRDNELIPLRKGGDEEVVCTNLHFEVLELLGTDKQSLSMPP